MRGITLYVEGGGNTNHGRAQLRIGFDRLLERQEEAARHKRVHWRTIFCGGRSEAAARFAEALRRTQSDVIALLVDAEGQVQSKAPARPTPDERRLHLRNSDDVRKHLNDADANQLHLMTACMEAWVFADREKLYEFYGYGFDANALPSRELLDEVPKESLLARIKTATQKTQKGTYGKIKHASHLLALVRAEAIAKRSVSFSQFTQWLDSTIERL